MEEVVGRRVKITLFNGALFDGYVNDLDTKSGRLSLEKVTRIEDGEKKRLPGIQHFFPDDIMDTEFGDEKREQKAPSYLLPTPNVNEQRKPRQTRGSVMKDKYTPAHLEKLRKFDPSSVVLSMKKDDGMTMSGSEAGSTGSDQDIVYHTDYTIIGTLNPVFQDAIDYIKKCKVIGVAVEGVTISRHGKLCWLQIATSDHVFLFDMLKLGPGGFSQGLKCVLEDENIQKVIHDCRMVSDILHHQYKVKLVNVFDTQVANVMVYRVYHNYDWPRYVDGLASCLVQHLDLSNEEVNFAVVRDGRQESDEAIWMERPLRPHVLDAALKNVKHLLDLRHILMEKMLAEFVAGVDVYLMHVRDASNADSIMYQGKTFLLPIAFEDLRHFMAPVRPRREYGGMRKDANGFRENCPGIMNPNVFFSRDSMWHCGTDVNTAQKTIVDRDNNGDGVNDNDAEAKKKSTPETVLPAWRRKRSNSPEPEQSPPAPTTTAPGPLTRVIEKLKQMDDVNSNVVTVENTNRHANMSRSGNISQGHHTDIDEEVEAAAMTNIELKGSKLMRALVENQGPGNITNNEDLNLKPAGQLIERKQKVSRRMHTQSSLAAAAKMPKPQSRPYMSCKSFTDEELQSLQDMYRKSGRKSSSPMLNVLGRRDTSAGDGIK